MKTSHFFYKELTPAEVGRTGTHEVYVRLPNNFNFEAFFNHSAVQNDTVIEVNFNAYDNTDGETEELLPLRFVYFINSNREKRIPSLGPLFRNHNVQEGDIVCLESRIQDDKTSYFITFYKKGTMQVNPNSIYFTKTELGNQPNNTRRKSSISQALQQIFYGAPGTGKSFIINHDTKGEEVIRTTFHPDTDYSSFVGAYKPTMKERVKLQTILDYESLVDKLKEYITQQQQNITKACTLFGFDFHDSIVQMQEQALHTIPQLVADGYKSGTTYDTQVRAGMSAYENSGIADINGEQIIYQFVCQSFLQAYVGAWRKYAEAGRDEPRKQYLVIEEINRGNCAQIFGDLFQLLDRNSAGFSDYPITADADMKKQLQHLFEGYDIEDREMINSLYDGQGDIVGKVLNGDILLLPKNMYIWATMNTSDQSLFPIDSAFKRRWNWCYIPISNRNKGYKIEVNGNYYDWWQFLTAINDKIWNANHSEDKKLGYFFVKSDDAIVKPDIFASKVIFYLWNDVFKDFIDESDGIFNDIDGTTLSFDKFYDTDNSGKTYVVDSKVEQFLRNLNLEPFGEVEDSDDEDIRDDDTYSNPTIGLQRDKSKYSINGVGKHVKKRVPLEVVSLFVRNHPEMTAQQVVDIWYALETNVRHMVITNEEYKQKLDQSSDSILEKRYYSLSLNNGETIYIYNQFTPNRINDLISKVHAQNWNIRIEKVEE